MWVTCKDSKCLGGNEGGKFSRHGPQDKVLSPKDRRDVTSGYNPNHRKSPYILLLLLLLLPYPRERAPTTECPPTPLFWLNFLLWSKVYALHIVHNLLHYNIMMLLLPILCGTMLTCLWVVDRHLGGMK